MANDFAAGLGGAAQGAASGAAMGSIVPGIGTAIGAIVGGVVGAFGSISGNKAKRKQAEAIAGQKRLQAAEVARRTASELDMLSDEINLNIGEQVTSFAGSGVDVSSGASVQAQMASFENYGRTVLNKQLESNFRVRQLNFEAANGISLDKDERNASVISAFGNAIKTASSIKLKEAPSLQFDDPIPTPASNLNFGGTA